MPPGDFVDAHPEHSSYFLALDRTRRPTAQNDRGDAAFIKTAAISQRGDVDRLFATQFGKDSRHIREDERTKVCSPILPHHPTNEFAISCNRRPIRWIVCLIEL